MPLRILFVTPYVPSRLRTRPLGFLQALAARGHSLTLVTAASSREEEQQAAGLSAICERVRVVRVSRFRSLANCIAGLRGTAPLQALYSLSPALSAAVKEEVARGIDVIHVEHLRAAQLGLEADGVARVFDAVDCITDLFEHAAAKATSFAERSRARLDLDRTRRYEGWLWRRFDAALVTSDVDRAALLRLSGAGPADDPPLAVIPNGVDLDYFSPGTAPRNDDEIVFVGRMGYHANVAAVLHLVERVMPRVWQVQPRARVTIVGADPAPTVRALQSRFEGVEVTGRVDDVRPYLRRAAIAVCPLIYAAGIQNKVLEAMACGTPVIASTPASAALSATPGRDYIRADGPEKLDEAILRTLAGTDLRLRLGAAGRAYVQERHDWNSVVAALEELYLGALARFRVRGQG